ncbi:MAG: glycosyltransferase family 4 protein [Planctomycetota bacterium]|nr:glycosyltransferase family 4 protein [Planctomycetota bacterium]
MRVLFVTASYLPESIGGVELHVEGLARSARAAGHDAVVFARTGRQGAPHLSLVRDEVEGVPVLRLSNTFEQATTFEKMYADADIGDRFVEVLDEVKPDVVHVHHLTCLSVSILERLRARDIPTVMTLHDFWMGCPRGQRITAELELCPEIRLGKCVPCLRELWPHLLGQGRAPGASADEQDSGDLALLEDYHAVMRRVLNGVDVLVTPSAFMRRMYEAYGVPAGRIQVVENGLPVSRFKRVPSAPRSAGPLRVGFIGSVLPSKGVHLLLEAIRQIGDPSVMRLDVWGEVLPFHHDRAYGQRLEALRSGFESVIELHGRYDNEDVPEILASFDVVVVPSIWYEAYALTLREAFLRGVPVVTANHGAMAEAVEDGVNGLLFEAGDEASLARALRRLVDDRQLLERLASSAHRVRDEADAAAELLGLYEQALSGRSCP